MAWKPGWGDSARQPDSPCISGIPDASPSSGSRCGRALSSTWGWSHPRAGGVCSHTVPTSGPSGRRLDVRSLRQYRAGVGPRRVRCHGKSLAVVEQVERLAVKQLVASMIRADVDANPTPTVQQPKRQPGHLCGQVRGEGEDLAVIAHAAEPGNRDMQGTGQRGQVETIGGVARSVMQVDEGRLEEVLVRQVEVSDLGGDNRLDRRRQRRIAHRDGLVVVKIAPLLLGGEMVAAEVERQDEVGLLY